MTGQSLLGWWNLVYILPFLLALLYLVMYALSGVTFGDADADGDFSADGDLDADGDADVGHVDLGDHDVAHHDIHHAQHPPFYVSALAWLGVGKVPLSILLMVWMLTWGAIGFVINQLMQPRVAEQWMTAMYSLPAALIGSLLITRGVVRLLVRYVPLNESYAARRHDLLGMTGEAIFAVDQTSGVCTVRDQHGNLHQIACRVEYGQPISKGSRVKLVGFNIEKSVFYVIPEPSAAAVGAGKQSEVAS